MLQALIAAAARRPVAVTQVFIGLLIFGLVAATRLPLTLLPELSYPTLTVRAELPGAAPEEVEVLLARPLEEALGAVPRLRRVLSRSQVARVDITLEYGWGTDMRDAVLDVRERLDALALPREATRPVVLRFDPQADPIQRHALLRDDGSDSAEAILRLRRVAEDAVQRPLESVPGVAAVEVAGGLEEEIQVVVDMARLQQFRLSLQHIADRLAAENADIAGGEVEQGSASYLVRTLNPFASSADIADTILARSGDRDVRVSDLAEVRQAARERDTVFRVDGREAVEIAVYKEGDANTVAVARAASEALSTLSASLPDGFRLVPLFDQSRFIRAAVAEVRQAALWGGLLAVTVLWLFLGRGGITLIIALAIPVSVIATFNLMAATGIGFNVMSLGGIALAVGMLVDDAVVVLENVARKREAGLDALRATVQGAREVAGPVIASTLTTVAVFLPLVFVEGVAGQLFIDQAVVVSGALMVSMLVALTLIPALAARGGGARRLPAPGPAQQRLGRWLRPPLRLALAPLRPPAAALRLASARFRGGFDRLASAYARGLPIALDRPLSVGLVLLLLALASALALPRLGLSLVPPFAQEEFRLSLSLPAGSPLAGTDAVASRIAVETAGIDGIARVYSTAGAGTRLNLSAEAGADHEAEIAFLLTAEGQAQAQAIKRRIAARLAPRDGLGYRFREPTLFTFDAPLEVELGGYALESLAAAAQQVETLLAAGDYDEVENSARSGRPQLRVVFDEARIAALGLTTAAVADSVSAAVDGIVSTRFRLPDREVDIRVRGDDALRQEPAALRSLVVNPEAEAPLPLAAVAEIRREAGPAEILRRDGQRVAVVSASPRGQSLDRAARDLEQRLAAAPLPASVTATVSGQSDELRRALSSGLLALALAVFLVYLIMAAQFESLAQPLIILLTVPLAGIGAVLTLWATATALNVVALVGFLVLAGIVVKNGMVLVDLANRLRAAGDAPRTAIVKAASARLRPILITTTTTMLGLTPMLLGGVEGAELRRPLALTLIGGLGVSALLTLVVVPLAYQLLAGRGGRA